MVVFKEGIIVHTHIEKTINSYCIDEEKNFKESKYFLEIISLTHVLGFSAKVSCGENTVSNKHLFPKIVYLEISIVDETGKTVIVNELDNEHLSYATSIVEIDKKKRIILKSWEDDEDFIETLAWIIKELNDRVNA